MNTSDKTITGASKKNVIPIIPETRVTRRSRLARLGDWIRDHQRVIGAIQWAIVLIYAALLFIPAAIPLPGNEARILNNMTKFAEFVFWGIWWPFVLVSMVLFGRLWCGTMCPEGFLSEFSSKRGLGKPIPKWMRWPGWPFVAFAITTIYGQLVSVYQYPYPALLILGGSTLAAMIFGYLFTKGKRAWCKYLCPVSGVFSLLSKIAPIHFKVDKQQWDEAVRSKNVEPHAPDCAPMLGIRNMTGASNCHMCARCSDYHGAVELSWRNPTDEIVIGAAKDSNKWQSMLIIVGLLGIAIGAFHWTVSPHFQKMIQALNSFFINNDIYWILQTNAPWFLLTNYPENQDQMSWAYGGGVLAYILFTTVVMTTLISIPLIAAVATTGKFAWQRFHHLAQSLIPIAAMGVFLGLSATTVNLLKQDFYPTWWANSVRLVCLLMATFFCAYLGFKIIRTWKPGWFRTTVAFLFYSVSLVVVCCAWGFMFWWW